MDKLVKYLCIIQARVNSSRLPAKIMLDLAGKTLLERVYETVSKSTLIDKVVVATSNKSSDNIIETKLNSLNIECFRGDLDNVLKRFFDVAKKYQAQHIVRVTADNPLMDGKLIDQLILYYEKSNGEYSMFTNGIYGLSAEVFSFKVLNLAQTNSRNDYDREHVTPYIRENCATSIIDIEEKFRNSDISVTVDTLDDYIKMQDFYLYCEKHNLSPTIDSFLRRSSLKGMRS